MRREHDVRHGCSQPFAQPPASHHLASDLRDPNLELFTLRCELACHDSQQRFATTRGWRVFCAHGSRWNQRASVVQVWGLSALARRFITTMAIDNGVLSSRWLAPHRVQHVGIDGHRAADRRAVRLGTISFHLRGHRNRRVSLEQPGRPLQHRRLRLVARLDWSSSRDHNESPKRFHANAAEPVDQMADLHRDHGIFDARDR